ncbi:MAG: HNH endonuclease [Paraclostridium sp.]
MNKNYREYLKSNEWKEIKNLVLKRDGNKCIKCGSSNNLQIHHTTYVNIFNESENLDDLITLCSKCHMEEHNIEINSIDDFILKINNQFVMQNINMKPSEYILYLSILMLIQKSNISKNKYIFNRKDLYGIFNNKSYEKSILNNTLSGMIKNQIEDIILDCDYNGKELVVILNRDIYYKYFILNNNYTTLNIKDFMGIKGTQIIKIMMLFSRFCSTGWIRIREEDVRILLGKCNRDTYKTKHITREIKNIVNKFDGKYSIKNFTSSKVDSDILYEFTFNKFKNTIGGAK